MDGGTVAGGSNTFAPSLGGRTFKQHLRDHIKRKRTIKAPTFVASSSCGASTYGRTGTPQTYGTGPHKFASTQFNLTGAIAKAVLAAAKRIPESSLAGDGRESEPHVTVKYGLHSGDHVSVSRAIDGQEPARVTFGKASIFPAKEASSQRGGEQYDVVKIDVESPSLHRLNAKIAKLPHTDTHPKYKPHVTLAYVKAGEGKKYAGKSIPGVTGQKVTLDKLVFSGKDGTRTICPLTKDGDVSARTPDGHDFFKRSYFENMPLPKQRSQSYGRTLQSIAFVRGIVAEQYDWHGPKRGPRGGTYYVNSETGAKIYREPKDASPAPGVGHRPTADETITPKTDQFLEKLGAYLEKDPKKAEKILEDGRSLRSRSMAAIKAQAEILGDALAKCGPKSADRVAAKALDEWQEYKKLWQLPHDTMPNPKDGMGPALAVLRMYAAKIAREATGARETYGRGQSEQYAFQFQGPRSGRTRTVWTKSDLPKSIQASGAYQEIHATEREKKAKESLPFKAVKNQGSRVQSHEDVEKVYNRLQDVDYNVLRSYAHGLDIKGKSRSQISDKVRALLLLKATEKAAKKGKDVAPKAEKKPSDLQAKPSESATPKVANDDIFGRIKAGETVTARTFDTSNGKETPGATLTLKPEGGGIGVYGEDGRRIGAPLAFDKPGLDKWVKTLRADPAQKAAAKPSPLGKLKEAQSSVGTGAKSPDAKTAIEKLREIAGRTKAAREKKAKPSFAENYATRFYEESDHPDSVVDEKTIGDFKANMAEYPKADVHAAAKRLGIPVKPGANRGAVIEEIANRIKAKAAAGAASREPAATPQAPAPTQPVKKPKELTLHQKARNARLEKERAAKALKAQARQAGAPEPQRTAEAAPPRTATSPFAGDPSKGARNLTVDEIKAQSKATPFHEAWLAKEVSQKSTDELRKYAQDQHDKLQSATTESAKTRIRNTIDAAKRELNQRAGAPEPKPAPAAPTPPPTRFDKAKAYIDAIKRGDHEGADRILKGEVPASAPPAKPAAEAAATANDKPHMKAFREALGDDYASRYGDTFNRFFDKFDTLPEKEKANAYRSAEKRGRTFQSELGAKIAYAGMYAGLTEDGMRKVLDRAKAKPSVEAAPVAAQKTAAPSAPSSRLEALKSILSAARLNSPKNVAPAFVPPVKSVAKAKPTTQPVAKPAAAPKQETPSITRDDLRSGYEDQTIFKDQEDGIVAIPKMFKYLKQKHPNLTIEQFHDHLKQMEQEGNADLMVINEERLAKDPELSIRTPGGLKHYVYWHDKAAKSGKTPTPAAPQQTKLRNAPVPPIAKPPAKAANAPTGSVPQPVQPMRPEAIPDAFSADASDPDIGYAGAIKRHFGDRIVGGDKEGIFVKTKYGGPLANWIKANRAGHWDSQNGVWKVKHNAEAALVRHLRLHPQAYSRQARATTYGDRLRGMMACR